MTKNDIQRTKEFFDKWQDYTKTVLRWHNEIYEDTGRLLNMKMNGIILDVGNGGVFNYDLNKMNKVITFDLVNKKMDYPEPIKNVKSYSGDARNMPFKNFFFDGVLSQFLIHHMAEKDKKTTNANVEQYIAESYRVLKKNGKIFIIDRYVSKALEAVEDIFFPINSRLLSIFDKPMIKLFSLETIQNLLKRVGFNKINNVKIKMGRYVVQYGIRTPTVISPGKVYLIEGVK